VIMYADRVTDSMRKALDETERRRELQQKYNQEHGITPQTVKRNITDLSMAVVEADYLTVPMAAADGAEYKPEQLPEIVAALEAEMKEAARELDFEKAAQLRDRLIALKNLALGLPEKGAKAAGTRGLLSSGAFADAAALGKLRGAKRAPQRRRRR
jgi:excinuclease ABC subunit B